jgi:hypothetical protein
LSERLQELLRSRVLLVLPQSSQESLGLLSLAPLTVVFAVIAHGQDSHERLPIFLSGQSVFVRAVLGDEHCLFRGVCVVSPCFLS